MEYPAKAQGPNLFMAAKSSPWSKFFKVVGLASLSVAFFGSVRLLLHLFDIDSFTSWDSPNSILFYLPAGAILLMADHRYRKSQMPHWLLGSVIGFAVYVSLHWLTDLGSELRISGIFGIPLYMSLKFGELLWHPIWRHLLRTYGSALAWIDLLGISWFTAIPFIVLGMIYAQKSRWLLLLAIILSLILIFFCLSVLFTEILYGLMG